MKEKIKEIVKYPDPILKTECEPVTDFEEAKKIIQEMLATMMSVKNDKMTPAGLHAKQIGYNLNLFIALDEVFINSEVLWIPSEGHKPCKEGCLSLEENKFDYPVTRAYAIKIKYQDLEGDWHTDRYNGFKSQVIQHELAHGMGYTLLDE